MLLYLPHQLATLIGGLGIILIRTQLDMASAHGGDFLWAFSQADTPVQACPSWATATEATGRDSGSTAPVFRRRHPGLTRCCAKHKRHRVPSWLTGSWKGNRMQTYSLILRFTGSLFGKRALCREREATSSSLSARQQHGMGTCPSFTGERSLLGCYQTQHI